METEKKPETTQESPGLRYTRKATEWINSEVGKAAIAALAEEVKGGK